MCGGIDVRTSPSTLLHSAVDTVTNKCCFDRFVGAPTSGRVRRLRRDPVRGECGDIHCLFFLVNYLYIYALVSRNYDGLFLAFSRYMIDYRKVSYHFVNQSVVELKPAMA